MRDLTARLRDIVRSNPRPAEPRRELTYVPDVPSGSASAESTAEQLGGDVQVGKDGSTFVRVDRTWDATEWHGRRRVESCAVDGAAPIALFDPRLAGVSDWASRIVYFDIETTGLSGGAGMIAFLVGCGWYEDEGFRVRQFFLTGPAGESAMLDALAEIFDGASMLVTFNGRTFDVPVMDMRWAFHRKPTPTDDLPHFDMLPPARRLWAWPERSREAAGPQAREESTTPVSCSLTSLERSILGFHRIGDVPGLEIPTRYFHFLRTGDASAVEGVLQHNRLDILSLAAVTAHALRLATDGPEGCRDAGEQVALGRLYERAGDPLRAVAAYELATSSHDPDARRGALARLAVLLRRESRYDESAQAWQGVLDLASRRGRGLTTLERRAAEALAIHHEHRARDLGAARRYAEALRPIATGRAAEDVEHRLGRIDRKMKVAEKTTGGPVAAQLPDL